MIEPRLFLPFDLNDFRVMHDDFDGTEPNPFQCEQDCLFHRPIGNEAANFLG